MEDFLFNHAYLLSEFLEFPVGQIHFTTIKHIDTQYYHSVYRIPWRPLYEPFSFAYPGTPYLKQSLRSYVR